MKHRYFGAIAVVSAIAVFSAAAFAQARVSSSEKFIISAKAGAVNAVVGDVTVEREGGRTNRLFKGDEVQAGEIVSTGTDGKAEILMNPGSYIRIGANSSFQFDSTDLDDVRIKMNRGSAIFEVFGAEEFGVDVKAGTSRFALVDTGIYRVDIGADGNADVSIIKGKVMPSLDATKAVKSGKTLDYSGNAFAVVKYDKENKDDLDTWSADRARELSLVAKSLRPDRLRDPLINSFYGRRWDLHHGLGVWIYDPFYRSFCFLPFGYGWNSPYGFGFGRSIWYYGLPPVIYQMPPTAPTGVTKVVRPRGNQGSADAGFPEIAKQRANRSQRTDDGSIRPSTDGQKQRSVRPSFDPPVSSFPSMPTVVPAPSAPTRGAIKKP